MSEGAKGSDLEFESAPWFGVCADPKGVIYVRKLLEVRDELRKARERIAELESGASSLDAEVAELKRWQAAAIVRHNICRNCMGYGYTTHGRDCDGDTIKHTCDVCDGTGER